MGIDRATGTDADTEKAVDPEPADRPPPDQPGLEPEGVPSRLESRKIAAATNEQSTQKPAEDNSDASQPADQAATAANDKSESPLGPESTDSDDQDQPTDAVKPSEAAAESGYAPDITGHSELEPAATDGEAPTDATPPDDTDGPDQTALQDSDTDGDAELQRRTSGEGLPDDNARVADLDEDAVEQSLSDWFKQAVAKLERSDRPNELTSTVDRPDFQDPQASPNTVPDRYGSPLERPDGTRTPLFEGEPTREQTQQGRLGDCGIIATLGAVAGHRPEAIRDGVRETDDGNYEVRLHEAKFSASHMRYEPTGHQITLSVTPDLPVYDKAPDRPAFADSTSTGAAWGPLLEKAIAGMDQTWTKERRDKATRLWNAQGNSGDAPSGYVRLNQGSNAGDRAELLTQLTGRPAKTVEFPTSYDNRGRAPNRQLLDEIRGQVADRNPVLVGTRSLRRNESPLVKDLQPAHAYEVTKVDEQGRLYLRNPWNDLHPEPLTISEFVDNIRPRYTTLESP